MSSLRSRIERLERQAEHRSTAEADSEDYLDLYIMGTDLIARDLADQLVDRMTEINAPVGLDGREYWRAALGDSVARPFALRLSMRIAQVRQHWRAIGVDIEATSRIWQKRADLRLRTAVMSDGQLFPTANLPELCAHLAAHGHASNGGLVGMKEIG